MIHFINPIYDHPTHRSGTIVALLALTLVGLVGFLALAIDLGMLAIAKTQAQNAADLAALTAARTLNGEINTTYNNANATKNAQNILSCNYILGKTIASPQLSITYGSYDYNQTTQTFNANFPPTTGVPYSAVSTTVTANNLAGAFSSVFGKSFLPTVTATAQAVHRPRDIGLVMDLSSSMRYGTLLGFDITSSSRGTNNADTLVPTFGHHSSSSALHKAAKSNRTSSYDNYTIPPSNTSAPTDSYTQTYINGFYSNAAYASTLVRAFDSYTSTDGGLTWTAPTSGSPQLAPSSYADVPGGDIPLFFKNNTNNYAKNVSDAVGGSSRNPWWELDGYSGTTSGTFLNADINSSTYPSGSAGDFYGYTQGPGYFGKTFMLWPPDPRRPLNTGTAAGSWTTPANDATVINQFLLDFGYTSADFNNTSVATTLSANITSSQTTIKVASSTNFPTSPFTQFRIMVGTEIMIVTAASTNTWTVQRGKDGTTAASRTSGTAVGLLTDAPLEGIFGVTTTSGSRTWPWPNDGGTTLGTYLTSNVYKPASSTKLTTSDAIYKKIMRLYNWNYVADSVGTTPCDWRIRFFGTDDNTRIFNTSGKLNLPGSSTYTINYNEILRWLTQAPNPFPTQLRAGRIKYYGSIPTAITGTWPSYGSTDQRFWVEFIDHVLGFRQTAAGTYTDISNMVGYGPDFTWGNIVRTAPPTSLTQYMSYMDNISRPLLRFWFSPMLMVDYLHNYNMYQNVDNYFVMQPGDTYEAPVYNGRQAFLATINTLQDNHPNDWFTLVFYSQPRNSASSLNRFNCVASPMGPNYAYASSALFFPFSTIKADGTCNNTEITPYDADPATGNVPSANFVDTPRPKGNTSFAMGLMLCYNQFAVTPTTDSTLRNYVTSNPITFPTGMAGGLGRKGSQKLIIFETDGLPNATATESLVSKTGYKYYAIRYDMNKPNTSEYPSTAGYSINNSTVLNEIYSLVQQLKSDYGTTRNPFRLHTVGFGPVFAGTDASSALTTLQTMQYYAGTQTSASTPLPSNQVITGTGAEMSSKMIDTFTKILQNGVQIALIK